MCRVITTRVFKYNISVGGVVFDKRQFVIELQNDREKTYTVID